MKYSDITKQPLKDFCEAINHYLISEKQLIINELKDLVSFFSFNSGKVMRGSFSIRAHASNRSDNGTVTSSAETILFSTKGYFIKSFYQEDFYGEYYTNHDTRIGDEEPEEFIPDYLNASLKAIYRILKEENGYFEITNKKFEVK